MSKICRRAQQRFHPFRLLPVIREFPAEQEYAGRELQEQVCHHFHQLILFENLQKEFSKATSERFEKMTDLKTFDIENYIRSKDSEERKDDESNEYKFSIVGLFCPKVFWQGF